MEKIKALIVKPGRKPKLVEIENSLRAFQEGVKGHIECIYPWPDVILICNEEGKIKNLTPNRIIRGQLIVGNFILVSDDKKGDFKSLTEEQIEFLKKELR